uniref:Uncharacterized protein n=1 Tax=Myotis myotis TaxID=51298 RepID=A0A7J7WVV2_MYOMY|nr:hypothetical protein mMyoMyo1_011917 [Myotis myotis]
MFCYLCFRFLLPLGKDLRVYFCAKHWRLRMNELLSRPWRTRCHYHVFWSFGSSFLLNQWSCVVCPLCVTSGHLGIRWCAVGKPWAGLGLEPSGAGPRAGPAAGSIPLSPSSCAPGLSEYLLVDA